MGRIIAIANKKGGVGKTTTSINLAASIAEMGKRVLAIDLDPQGNMTSGLGVDKNEVENTVYELMLDECSINESIQDTVVKGVRLIPSNVNLAGAELELLGINDKEYILKTAVDYIRDDYDFIVIDCPPSLNMLTVNAMTTADTVLVPIQCEYYALEGLSQLIHTINLCRFCCGRFCCFSRLSVCFERFNILYDCVVSRFCLIILVKEKRIFFSPPAHIVTDTPDCK